MSQNASYKHGHWVGGKPSLTLATWRAMMSRCHSTKAKDYKRYGAKGIKVCKRWHTFTNFLEDMGERPSREHTIDRKNNALGYSKSNCQWASKFSQACNRRTTKYVTYYGERIPIAKLARRLKIPRGQLSRRIEAGWPQERLAEPLKSGQSPIIGRIEYNGKKYFIAELAEDFGIRSDTLRRRIKLGWPIERWAEPSMGPRERWAIKKKERESGSN